MNNPFTVEETNLMCVFETSNRMKLMEEIRRVMLHIKDSDMEELAGQVLRKLDGMTLESPTKKRWYGLAVTANVFGIVLVLEAFL